MPDAFSVRDGQTDSTYESLLNLNGDGMMGYVEIPVIDVSIPIYHYTTDETLEKGAGHLFGSSLPVGGKSTHCILSAHRGLPSAKLFTDLNLVEEGDVFYLHVLGKTLAYEAVSYTHLDVYKRQMCDYVVLPLLNSSFEPGRAREVVEGFVDVDLRNIARAELFYFTGQAEECCEITRGYLSSRVIELKLSACILYGYSNLSLGNVAAAKRGMEGIQSCVKIAMKKKVPKDVYASCLLAGYVGAVLLHLPTDGMPAFGEYSRIDVYKRQQ